jgi:hypothetical protein
VYNRYRTPDLGQGGPELLVLVVGFDEKAAAPNKVNRLRKTARDQKNSSSE